MVAKIDHVYLLRPAEPDLSAPLLPSAGERQALQAIIQSKRADSTLERACKRWLADDQRQWRGNTWKEAINELVMALRRSAVVTGIQGDDVTMITHYVQRVYPLIQRLR